MSALDFTSIADACLKPPSTSRLMGGLQIVGLKVFCNTVSDENGPNDLSGMGIDQHANLRM